MSNYNSYYILDGRYEELGVSELKALLETYEDSHDVRCYTMICLGNSKIETLYKVALRAGFIKDAGRLLGVDNLYSPSYNYTGKVKDRFTWIKTIIFKSTISREQVNRYLKTLYEKTGLNNRYKRGKTLYLMLSGSLIFIGESVRETTNKKLFMGRKKRDRPFIRSIALTPDISRYLINLARVREGEILLDPFVGTGSILLEAGLMGIRGVGVDIDKELVEGSKKNLESYNLRNQLLIIGDSTSLTYHRVDGIATDPPYGRGASTHGLDLKRIYDLFIGNASESVKDRGYIIFMSPLHMEEYVKKIICEYGLIIRGIHYMYVHGGLTRVIYEVFKP